MFSQNKEQDVSSELISVDLGDSIDAIPLKTPIAQAVESQNVIDTVKTLGWLYCQEKLPSLKEVLVFVASVFTSLPISVYAFTFPMHIGPEFLTHEHWQAQPLERKVLAVVFALTTISVASTVMYQHIPTMFKRTQEILLSFKEIISNFSEGLPTVLKNCFILFLSFVAALSSLALGYYGFLWAGQTIAIGAATVNFLMTLGFRLEYLPALIEKISTMFDKNIQFQVDVVNELKRMNKEYKEDFESSLKTEMQGKPIHDDMMRTCLLNLYDKTQNSTKYERKIFRSLTTQDIITAYLKKAADLSLGGYVGASTCVLYSQYGYDGFRILFQSFADLNGLPHEAQLAIGLFVSLSSVAVGFMTALEIINSIQFAVEYMKQDPAKNIAKIVFLTAACGISTTSLAGAVNAMTNKPNLFNITSGSVSNYVLLSGNCMFGMVLNASATLTLISKYDGTHSNALRWLNKSKLSNDTISALRKHSHFKALKNESTPLLIEEDLTGFEMRRLK